MAKLFLSLTRLSFLLVRLIGTTVLQLFPLFLLGGPAHSAGGAKLTNQMITASHVKVTKLLSGWLWYFYTVEGFSVSSATI